MRPDKRIDHVSILINQKLSNLPPTPPEACIFKVHHQLRQVNEKAYEPQMLSIGPYHRGKDSIQVMEEHKLRYLQQLLERRNKSSLERYVLTLRGLEERGRNCYAESVSLTVDEFVEMMLLDGCFIIELFQKYVRKELRDIHDPIFNMDWIFSCVTRDLLLFENQLPFFVVSQLFNMIKEPHLPHNLTDLALLFFKKRFPPLWRMCNSDGNSSSEIKHLLGLVHNTIISSFAKRGSTRDVVDKKEKWAYIQCATELKEAGVKFKKVGGGNFLDIKFKNGVMEIPSLMIEDKTESVFRNLIAYEQYYLHRNLNYFTDYVTFMDSLINSSKDVELLRRQGIIDNWLGDDEVISTMFNKLRDHVLISNFCYAAIFNNVNKHCSKRWNVWMAKLRHNYFHSPWALFSFLAAVLLLLLTLAQTLLTILSYLSSNS